MGEIMAAIEAGCKKAPERKKKDLATDETRKKHGNRQ
jgi:hypothetical protein